jgi:glucose/arabinose dehydrogenase
MRDAFNIEPLEARRLLTALPAGFAESLVTDDVQLPTAMAVAPDGRVFVAEQGGALRVIKNGQLLPAPFTTVNVNLTGERGLIGVVLDPAFSSNGYVYVYYTPSGSTANRVSRFTAAGDLAAAGSERELFRLDATGSEAQIHQGGAMHFGTDGKLYVATGDHGGRTRVQLLTNQVGKILRINPDGSIPSDNPFFNQTTGKNKAIWAVGLRNPFTFAVQPGTGRMFINDVGENTWEEINEGRAGANYGWPDTEGMTTDPRFDAPVYAYHHTEGKAIVGGTFYNPPAGAASPFPSAYVGDYLFMDHTSRYIKRLDTAGNAVSSFADRIVGKPVDIDVAPDGGIYYLTRQVLNVSEAAVYRVHYTGSSAPGISAHPSSLTVPVGQPATFTVSATGAGTLSYQWQRDGQNIAGATGPGYTLAPAALADSGAQFRATVTNASGSVTSNAATLTVTSNRAPSASITSPSSGTRYSGGSVINFGGAGTDPEDGALPAGAYTWRVDFHHDDHTHPFVSAYSGQTGGSFTVPRIGELSPDVWYRIHLTVRDSDGLTHSSFKDVLPLKGTLTLASSVPGLRLALDGTPVTTPHSVAGVAGITRTLSAPHRQVLDGVTYGFIRWSGGGARTRDIAFPSSGRTYTAVYRPVLGAARTLAATADAYVRDGDGAARNYGADGQLLVKSASSAGLNRHAYLKFDLGSLGGIGSATLRLFGRLNDASASAGVLSGVFAASDAAWTESGLTWNSRPSIGATPLASVRVSAAAAQWYEVDLTGYLREQKAAGQTSVTLVLKNLADTNATVGFNSDEAASNRPQLVVTA